MNKINVARIIRDHIWTLRNGETGRLSASDIILFYLFPLLVSGLATLSGWNFKADVVNGILYAFAIFAAILPSLLVLVLTLSQISKPVAVGGAVGGIRREIVRQVHSNLSYAILIAFSIVVVALLGLTVLKQEEHQNTQATTNPVFTFLLSFLTINFGLTMLMILKRMHIVSAGEFDRAEAKKAA